MLDERLSDEDARISALHRLQVLDTPVEAPFEHVVTLVRTVLKVPIATVTLVDRERQWFKAQRGLDQLETPRAISFCTHTIQQREPLIVADAHLDDRFRDNALVVGSPHIRSYAGIPLQSPDGYNIGSLCAMDVVERSFGPEEIAVLKSFAAVVCNELELRLIANVDQLTGALTRRGFVEQAERELERTRRHARPAALVLFDLDHFKSINDSFGHAGGDKVLGQVGIIAEAALRPSDRLGRVGGEEFALLLPETDNEQAIVVAERVRHMITSNPVRLDDGRVAKASASFGIASLEAGMGTVTAWMAAADLMLYQAKTAGRNCVRSATGAIA